MNHDTNNPAGRPALDPGELLLALATVAFGLAVVWQTTMIRLTPAYSMVGPRVLPYIVGGGLVAIGIWVAVEAVTGRGPSATDDSEDADPTLPTDRRALGLVAAALVAYLLLLEPAGFILASAVLFVGAASAMGSRRTPRDAAIGILLAAALYLTFTRGLGIRLPAGIFGGIF